MPWARDETDVEQSEAIARRMHGDFGLRTDLPMLVFERGVDGAEGRIVGGTGLHRIDWGVRRFEIGYWRRRGFAGRGVTSESVKGLSRTAFDVLKARRVAERAGFTFEGLLRADCLTPSGEVRHTRVYSRVRGIEESA